MRESIIYSSDNNNVYIYDARHNFSLLIHPELAKVNVQSKDTDTYYLKKYAYLKDHGFWKNAEPPDFETTLLDESVVKENIIHTPQIVFEVTDHCNLNCPYCSLGELYEVGKRDRKNIDANAAIMMLNYIFDLKIKHKQKILKISFFGGEPLMNFNFIKQIVETANQLNAENDLEIIFFMTTNATLIHKHIHFLVEHKIRLLISLDGNGKGHSYRTFAHGNQSSFHTVIANVDMIHRDFPEYFDDKVSFNAVLHNRNSIKNIYEFIYSRYKKIPRIAQLNTGDVNPSKKDLFKRMFQDKIKSESEYLKESTELIPGTLDELILFQELNRFINNFSINYYISNALFLLYDRVKIFPTGTCMPFEKKIFLNTHNNLLPCDKINYKYSFGKVNEQVIIDIPAIVRKYKLFYEHIQKVCQNCYASARPCRVCLLTLSNLDKLDEQEMVCNEFQDKEAFNKKLNRMFSILERNNMNL